MTPTFGIDLDGTLGDYHGHFWAFACDWTGRTLPHPNAYDGTQPFWRYLGMSKETYRAVKLAYRQGGLKRSMPVYEGAAKLTRGLRAEGGVVVIATTRPYKAMPRMLHEDHDHWFRRNGCQYDDVIDGEHKYRRLYKVYGKSIVAVLDDLHEMVCQAAGLGIPALLLDKPYNRHSSLPEGCYRVEDLAAAKGVLEFLLKEWKANE